MNYLFYHTLYKIDFNFVFKGGINSALSVTNRVTKSSVGELTKGFGESTNGVGEVTVSSVEARYVIPKRD